MSNVQVMKTMEGTNFKVEIIRWTRGHSGFIWNIYCYIHRDHPLYSKLPASISGGEGLHFHGGCTFFDYVGEYKKYGCDYNHMTYIDMKLHDISKLEEAIEVVEDAKILYNQIEAHS